MVRTATIFRTDGVVLTVIRMTVTASTAIVVVMLIAHVVRFCCKYKTLYRVILPCLSKRSCDKQYISNSMH